MSSSTGPTDSSPFSSSLSPMPEMDLNFGLDEDPIFMGLPAPTGVATTTTTDLPLPTMISADNSASSPSSEPSSSIATSSNQPAHPAPALTTTRKAKKAKKPKNTTGADVADAMCAFSAYADGSMFVFMQYFQKLEERLTPDDYTTFKTLITGFDRDPATISPDERAALDAKKEVIFDLLRPYGQDLIDAWVPFERSAIQMMRGSSYFR